tara:strand:+ start:6209 stop:7135 length:927 start_codon:yes stop_codon:yes gene_type:complete
MKKIFKSIFYLALFFLANQNSYGFENKIIFKINNQIITSYDLMKEINYLSAINSDFKNLEKNQSTEIAKKSLIREKIKEIELKKFVENIEIEKKLLDKMAISYFKRLGVNSTQDFEQYFLKKNINPNIIRKKISLEVLWNKLIYEKFFQSVKIDKNSIKNSLVKNTKQIEYLLSEILFNLDDSEKLNSSFNDIKEYILKNNFKKAALKYSISDTANKGGELGWVKTSVLSQKVKDELKKINVNEHTKPIVIPGGFLILKINNLRETEKKYNLEEEMKIIIRKKTNDQLNQFSNIYFNKIKKNILIDEI